MEKDDVVIITGRGKGYHNFKIGDIGKIRYPPTDTQSRATIVVKDLAQTVKQEDFELYHAQLYEIKK